MKKLTTALIAAGLTLSASACVSHPQLTTAETCERITSVMSSPPGGKTGMISLANQIRTIEPVSSDDMKSTVQNLLDYADESAKATPDAQRLTELQTEAGKTYGQFCR
jgi:hypothetical protein